MLSFSSAIKIVDHNSGVEIKTFLPHACHHHRTQNEGKSQATNLMTFPEFSLILCALTTTHGKSFNRIETKSILDIECRLCS